MMGRGRDQIADLFEAMPTRLLADAMRGFQQRGLLAEFRDWLDHATDNEPHARGAYASRLLWACDEAIEFGSDAGEVLRCVVTADQLAMTRTPDAGVPLRDRIAALRPQSDEDAA